MDPLTLADDALRRPRASAPAPLVTDLERFWPSRRGHAFDEFCR